MRGFESCRGHSPRINRNQALTRADADIREREPVSLGLPVTDPQASIPGGRPYDLRRTCITTWLNAGVPVAEVARRIANSPEVIHRVYEGCIYGQDVMDMKIEKELGWR